MTRAQYGAAFKRLLRNWMPPALVKALRPTPAITFDAIFASAPATIAAARAAGLSVYDFIHQLWGNPEISVAYRIEKLHSLGVISPTLKTIVEIGPGTGMYIQETLKYCRPQRYQIYETDRDWSEWLAKTYPVEDCYADGRSLGRTESNSVDLIQAYGVFVYLPLMVSIRYFREIARVAAPGAFVVFDIISERCLDEKTTEAWLDSGVNYPCFLSTAYVSRLFEDNGFRPVDSLLWPHMAACTEHLIFRKLETSPGLLRS